MKQGKRKFKPNLLKRTIVGEDGIARKIFISAKAYKKIRGLL